MKLTLIVDAADRRAEKHPAGRAGAGQKGVA
jgi:hypothetical protein